MADSYDKRGGKKVCKLPECGAVFYGFGDFCVFAHARAFARRKEAPKVTERKEKKGARSH